MYPNKKIRSLLLTPILYSIHLFAQDYDVVSGSAQSTVSGNKHTIETSPHAILNWKEFSIAAKEHLHFAQKNAASSVLNRVTGNQLSQILGTLSSNGKVYLINPSGIFIGKDACIQTAGFLASTANFSNDDFIKGQELFLEALGEGAITNQGKISCADGDIFLIAKQVTNDGECSADYVGAGPAFQVIVQPTRGDRLYIRPTLNASAQEIKNTGDLKALTVELKSASVYEKAIQMEGKVSAANVHLSAEQGGVSVDGQIIAPQGNVIILGKELFVGSTAQIDVSADQGGQIYVGGGMRGGDPTLFNATNVTVNKGAQLSADGTSGDAGKIIIWSNDTTEFEGDISAQALGATGDGGFIEVSGAKTLKFDAQPQLRAESGKYGTLLLDPGSVDIISGTITPPTAGGTFTDGYINNFLSVTGSLIITTATQTNGNPEVLTVGTASSIFWTTSNDLGLIASQNMVVYGTILATGAGGLTLEGNPTGTFTGDFSGVDIFGASLTTNSGPITIIGVGGTATTNEGIFIFNAGQITTTSGALNLYGKGGTGTSGIGIFSSGPGNLITSTSGTITLAGTSQSTGGNACMGVNLTNSTVSVTGTSQGGINIAGIAGAGADLNHGVDIVTSTVGSGPGNLTIFGLGKGTGTTSHGVFSTSSLVSAGTGSLLIDGTTNASGGNNLGIFITTGTVSTSAGTLTMNGLSTATGIASHGLEVSQSDIFSAAGSVTLSGVGGSGASTFGAFFGNSPGSVTATAGPISIYGLTGAGASSEGIIVNTTVGFYSNGSITFVGTSQGASAGSNNGIDLKETIVNSAGTGNINMLGKAGSGTDNNVGILFGTVSVIGNTGNISIAGTAQGSGLSNYGVRSDSSFIANASGSISLMGTGSSGSGTNNSGILFGGGTVISTSGNIAFTGTTTSTGSSGEGVNLQTSFVSTGGAGVLSFTGFGHGGATGAHGVEVVQTSITSSTGSVTLIGVSGTSATSYGVTFNTAPGSVTSTSGAITVYGLTGTGSSSEGIFANAVNGFFSSGPIILVGTSQGATLTSNSGVDLRTTPVTCTGSGSVTIIGLAGSGTDSNIGANFGPANITTNTGAITIEGKTRGTGQLNYGVQIGSSVLMTTSGAVSITGTGSSGTGIDNTGILINGGTVHSTSGDLAMNGTSTSAGNFGEGINLLSSSVSTSFGRIDLIGHGGNGTGNNNGIDVEVPMISTATGTIFFIGVGGSATSSDGILIGGPGGTVTSNSGTITLFGLGGIGSNSEGILCGTIAGMFSGGNITLVGTSQGTGVLNVGVDVNNTIIDTTGAANLGLIGVGGPGTNQNHGVSINTGTVTVTDGTLIIVGTAVGSGASNNGVLSDLSFLGATGAGGVLMTGASNPTSASAGTGNVGILLAAGSITTSVGPITLAGTSTSEGDSAHGIENTNTRILTTTGNISATGISGFGDTSTGIEMTNLTTSTSGTITMNGLSQGTVTGETGILLQPGATVITGGVGDIGLFGMGGPGTTGSNGIFLDGPTTSVTNTTGLILVVGTSQGAANSWGIEMSAAQVTTTTGPIDLVGFSSISNEDGILMDSSSRVQGNNSSGIGLVSFSDIIIQNGSNVNALGTTPVLVSSSRDLSVLGGASLPAYISIENGNATIVVSRDLNVVSGTGAGSEAQIGNHGGLVASASGNMTFSSVGNNVNVTATDSNAFALIGHGTPATAQTLSGDILFTSVGTDITLTGGPTAGAEGFAQIGHVNSTAGGSTLSGNITATARHNINVLGGAGAATAYAQIGHGGQVGAATYGASNVTLLAGLNCSITSSVGDAIVSSKGGDVTLVVDNLFPTPPGIGPGAFSFASTLTATGNLKIYTARRPQNNVPTGTVINGLAYAPGPLFVDSDTEEWSTYFPGGTYTTGEAFKIYYKDNAVPPPVPPVPVPAKLVIADLGSLADSIDQFFGNLLKLKCLNFYHQGQPGFLYCEWMPYLLSSVNTVHFDEWGEEEYYEDKENSFNYESDQDDFLSYEEDDYEIN